MKKSKFLTAFICVVLSISSTHGQDPSFAQFFSSPLNINPALTAHINSDWRVISNIRDQWIGPASPYMTGTISYDGKIMQNKIPNVWEDNYIGLGGMLMFDKAMGGIAKSVYGSVNLSYNIKISEYYYTQHLAIGFGGLYGQQHVDFSKLDFQSQFTGHGFDTNMPTGESALSNMKPNFSLNTGILYSVSNDVSNFDIGVAGYHLNKPRQTFLEDENQRLAIRSVAHSNFETIVNDDLVLSTNAIYQKQSGASYFSVGGSLGYYLQEDEQTDSKTMVNAGLWYWSKNALIPYVGFVYKDLQIGLSYDVTISKLAQAQRKPSSFEVSLIFRGVKKPSGVIPCPWK